MPSEKLSSEKLPSEDLPPEDLPSEKLSDEDRSQSLDTRALHEGALHPRPFGAVSTPVFQTANFEYHGEEYHDVGYLRLSNSPNHAVLHRRIASLEGTEDALVTGSGMAAISSALLTFLSAGDHLLVQDVVYGGTANMLEHDLPRWGINHTKIDPQDPASWEAAMTATTRLIYVETLTNPLVQMADLEAVVAFARANGLISIIDNTFASPVLCRPAELGFDLVMESATKYMNGHNDLVAGSISGSAERVRRIKLTLDHLGGSLDPHACVLLERGLKTIGLRIRRQSANALKLAGFLAGRSEIACVHYPGLADHPQHARAARLLKGGFGGMMGFVMAGGAEAGDRLASRLRLPAFAASLGGVESLIIRPAAAIHSGLPREAREGMGIDEGLMRFSTGVEAVEDLIADFAQAL